MLSNEDIMRINKQWEGHRNNPRTIYAWLAKKGGIKAYQPYITGLIANDIEILKTIQPSPRKEIFKYHSGTSSVRGSNQHEKRFAMALCHDSRYNGHYVFGTCVEYELPLCPRKGEYIDGDNKEFGNIDLLCRKDNTIYMIEVKKDESQETLLRAVMEAYTYWKQGSSVLRKEIKSKWGIDDPHLCVGVLIFKDSKPEKELKSLINNKALKKIIEQISNEVKGFKFFIVDMKTRPGTKAKDKRIYFKDSRWNEKKIVEYKIK